MGLENPANGYVCSCLCESYLLLCESGVTSARACLCAGLYIVSCGVLRLAAKKGVSILLGREVSQ